MKLCLFIRFLLVSPVLFFSFLAASSQPLTDFYRSYLAHPSDFQSWEMHDIEDSAFIPKSAGPVDPDFNKVIFWAINKSSEKVAGFRAFNVSTGCQTGCTPVIFHLMFDPKGRVLKLIQDPQNPLRKIHHASFDDQDTQRLEKILKETEKALCDVRHPSALTNNHYGFPPQTFTYYQNTVIKGAAYSSYVILNAALENSRYLQGKKSIFFDLSFLFKDPSPVDFNAQIAELKSIAASKGPEHLEKKLKDSGIEKKIPEFNFHFLRMMSHLMFDKNPCSKKLSFADEQTFEDFVKFCSYDPLVLEKLVQVYLNNKRKKEAAVFYIHLWLYHPDYAKGQSFRFLEEEDFFEELLERYKSFYLKSRLAEFSLEPLEFPSVLGKIADSNKRVTLPLEKNQKKVLLFFASWCGHCRSLIKNLVSKAPELLDEDIQLIEIFAYEDTFSAFKAATHLDTKRWPVIRIDDPNARVFYERISLFAVPRVMIVNDKGRILNFHSNIFDQENMAIIKRDLKWMLASLGI